MPPFILFVWVYFHMKNKLPKYIYYHFKVIYRFICQATLIQK